LETFLTPGKEILLAESADDVVAYMAQMEERELSAIGRRARERVLAEHTAEQRATEFEKAVAASVRKHSHSANEPEAEKLSTASS